MGAYISRQEPVNKNGDDGAKPPQEVIIAGDWAVVRAPKDRRLMEELTYMTIFPTPVKAFLHRGNRA